MSTTDKAYKSRHSLPSKRGIDKLCGMNKRCRHSYFATGILPLFRICLLAAEVHERSRGCCLLLTRRSCAQLRHERLRLQLNGLHCKRSAKGWP